MYDKLYGNAAAIVVPHRVHPGEIQADGTERKKKKEHHHHRHDEESKRNYSLIKSDIFDIQDLSPRKSQAWLQGAVQQPYR